MQEESDILLEMKDICKYFPGVKALDHVSFRLKKGSVHALMGENGAGKSTLMKCLFGIYSKDEGKILLNGREMDFKSPVEALDHGVAMVHQELNQALSRSVNDNIWLGRYPVKFGVIVSEKEMKKKTQKIFDDLDIHSDPGTVMSRMSVSDRQMVEIAKAVSYDAKVIVFDEPTSSLNDKEVRHLFRIINMLKERGCGIIYISHKMEEILTISDEVTIMRDGKWVDTQKASELTIEKIIRLMVGRDLDNRFPEKNNRIGKELLRVDCLCGKHNGIKDVSFSLQEGEILGIAGLAGAGRSELLEIIFGLAARDSGNIILEGREISNRSPREAIRNGFALLTEERRATGIFGVLSIKENTTISSLDFASFAKFILNEKKLKNNTEWAISSMKVKTPSQRTQIRTLSGGNQQKVILGRWLLTEPKILLLDEPTRGIDVGAKYEIYQLIIELASKGKSVIMVSSEMPELLGVCDRILVISGGRLAGDLDAKNASQEDIMTLAAKYV